MKKAMRKEVKFFSKKGNFGFTKDGIFFGGVGYKTATKSYRGIRLHDEELSRLPTSGEKILIWSTEETSKGVGATAWSLEEDTPMELFCVVKRSEETKESTKTDNDRRMHVTKIMCKVVETVVCAGTKEYCLAYIAEFSRPHYVLSLREGVDQEEGGFCIQ